MSDKTRTPHDFGQMVGVLTYAAAGPKLTLLTMPGARPEIEGRHIAALGELCCTVAHVPAPLPLPVAAKASETQPQPSRTVRLARLLVEATQPPMATGTAMVVADYILARWQAPAPAAHPARLTVEQAADTINDYNPGAGRAWCEEIARAIVALQWSQPAPAQQQEGTTYPLLLGELRAARLERDAARAELAKEAAWHQATTAMLDAVRDDHALSKAESARLSGELSLMRQELAAAKAKQGASAKSVTVEELVQAAWRNYGDLNVLDSFRAAAAAHLGAVITADTAKEHDNG